MTRVERAIDALRDALEQERAALREGRLDLIARMASQRETLMQELRAAAVEAPSRLDASMIAALRADAEVNQRLLIAAGQGIKSVIDRIAAIREAAGKLTTYGADGLKTDHVQARSQSRKLEHKA